MINRKMKADTKLTGVIWCQKFDQKVTAPVSGRFRRRRSTREVPVYLARHVCCSNFGIRGGLVNEAVTSCCESCNNVYQIRMVFPLIESQSANYFSKKLLVDEPQLNQILVVHYENERVKRAMHALQTPKIWTKLNILFVLFHTM